MVAEPVQATVQALKHYYYQASNYLEDQHDKIIHSSYYEKLLELTHFDKDIQSEVWRHLEQITQLLFGIIYFLNYQILNRNIFMDQY